MKGLAATVAFAILVVGAAQGEPYFATDAMTDDELRQFRNQMRAELQRLLGADPSEKTAEGMVYRVFYCTVYYTPREAGFTSERGFDATPITAAGLGGRKYARSFLQAVRREGFGRLTESVNGRDYLQYLGGRYAYAKTPLGSRGKPLVPRKSCAVSSKNPYLRHGRPISIDSPTVGEVFGTTEYLVDDTGGGIHPLQIDLYWGEDDPLGAVGRMSARPAGTRMEYAFDVRVLVRE